MPATRTTVDRRGLLGKLKAMASIRPTAVEEVAKALGDRVISEVILASPKDTHRYVAGHAEAANAAGLGPFTVPKIQKGRFAEAALPRLEEQVRKWQRIVEQYERTNRRDKWYNRAVRTRDRAIEELKKWRPDAIIIFGGGGRRLKVTVRDKVYGGDGHKILSDGKCQFVLHNKEPHASIVESRSHTLRAAMVEAKRFGFRLGGKAYTRRLIAAAGSGKGAGPLFTGKMGKK